MKKFLLLALLLGLPSPLFANDSTSGYKQEKSCIYEDSKFSLWKKEDDNSKNWGTYACDYDPFFKISSNCIWFTKAVSYDEAYEDYELDCSGK